MITRTPDGRVLIGATESTYDYPIQVIDEDGTVVAAILADGTAQSGSAIRVQQTLKRHLRKTKAGQDLT